VSLRWRTSSPEVGVRRNRGDGRYSLKVECRSRGGKKKKEEGKRGEWRGEKEESCVGGGENEGAGEREEAGRGGGRVAMWEEDGGEKKWGKENGGKRKKKGGGCGPAGGHASPPHSKCAMWHFATLAYVDVAFCHVTKW
jgi:hypothetical protein